MKNQLEENGESLRGKVVAGIKWLTVGKFSGQLLNWGMTLFVIRLVSPSDYGLMAMAMAFIGIVALVNEMGLGASIVQAESLEEEILPRLFGLTLSVNLTIFLISIVLAPLIAAFYAAEALEPLIRLLSLQFLVGAFCVMPKSLLERELNFKVTATVDFFANILSGIVALVLAFLGYGVWALAWGGVCLQIFRAVFLNIASPFKYFPRFELAGLRGLAKFGGTLSAERLLWYLYAQADIFILGKVLGSDLVGVYAVAKHLSSLPMQKISPLINQIALPAFSRIQHDKGRVAHNFLKGVQFIGLVSFPVFIGMAAVSEEIVGVVLGAKWGQAGAVLALLCLVMPFGMINGFMSSVTKAVGMVNITFGNMGFALLIMPIAILIGSRWGINGVGAAWVVGYPIIFIFSIIRCAPILNISWKQVLLGFRGASILSITMFFGVMFVKLSLGGRINEEVTLVLLVLTGISCYCLMTFMFRKKCVFEFLEVVKN